MPQYRLYQLDKSEHIVGPPKELELDDDQTALAKAKQFVDGKVVELWSGTRRIARIDPGEPKPNALLSAEFLGSDDPTRAKRCREFAAELERLAEAATCPNAKADYLELGKHWHALANEIEGADARPQG